MRHLMLSQWNDNKISEEYSHREVTFRNEIDVSKEASYYASKDASNRFSNDKPIDEWPKLDSNIVEVQKMKVWILYNHDL